MIQEQGSNTWELLLASGFRELQATVLSYYMRTEKCWLYKSLQIAPVNRRHSALISLALASVAGNAYLRQVNVVEPTSAYNVHLWIQRQSFWPYSEKILTKIVFVVAI